MLHQLVKTISRDDFLRIILTPNGSPFPAPSSASPVSHAVSVAKLKELLRVQVRPAHLPLATFF